MTKVLMVCLGNICRSPMAEGILRHRAKELGINIATDSCGTSNFHQGDQADNRSINTLKNKGIDISDLRARQFRTDDFEEFDFILVMDENNHRDVAALSPKSEHQEKIKLMLSFAPQLEKTNVPDPYFGSLKDFENVYDLLTISIDEFLKTIK